MWMSVQVGQHNTTNWHDKNKINVNNINNNNNNNNNDDNHLGQRIRGRCFDLSVVEKLESKQWCTHVGLQIYHCEYCINKDAD